MKNSNLELTNGVLCVKSQVLKMYTIFSLIRTILQFEQAPTMSFITVTNWGLMNYLIKFVQAAYL